MKMIQRSICWNGLRGASGFILLLLLMGSIPDRGWAQKEESIGPSEKPPNASYLDFDDILIPSDLSLDKKKSFVYSTSRSKVGILILEGRVEPSSLAGFFQCNMQKDGWRLLSSFKYREYLLNFVKEDRACVIIIEEKTFVTVVSIRVGPIEPLSLQEKGAP
jgi:hypothetical protein